MIDHLMIKVRDYPKSKAFYAAALAPLGYQVMMEFGGTVGGLGAAGKPDFWLQQDDAPHPRMHLAFAAPDQAAVDAFHRAALAAGASDFGAPGLRADYHPSYYAAFVLDLDGHNLEVVNHGPPAAAAGGAKGAGKAKARGAKRGKAPRAKPARGRKAAPRRSAKPGKAKKARRTGR